MRTELLHFLRVFKKGCTQIAYRPQGSALKCFQALRLLEAHNSSLEVRKRAGDAKHNANEPVDDYEPTACGRF